MELTEKETIEADAKRAARREMLIIVAAGKDEAEKALGAVREKGHEMTARRERSMKAAAVKIEAFRREKVTPAMRLARECDEAIQALYAEFVPAELVKARDAAENKVAHARIALGQHDRDERETRRLLKAARERGRIDKQTNKEWKAKIEASAKERATLEAELAKLSSLALVSSTALVDARAAALTPAAT